MIQFPLAPSLHGGGVCHRCMFGGSLFFLMFHGILWNMKRHVLCLLPLDSFFQNCFCIVIVKCQEHGKVHANLLVSSKESHVRESFGVSSAWIIALDRTAHSTYLGKVNGFQLFTLLVLHAKIGNLTHLLKEARVTEVERVVKCSSIYFVVVSSKAEAIEGIPDRMHSVSSPKNVAGNPRSSFDERHSIFSLLNIAPNIRR